MPPTDFVFSMVKNPPSIRALTTGWVSFRMFVVFVRGRGDQGHEIASFLYLRMDGRHGVSPAPRQRGS